MIEAPKPQFGRPIANYTDRLRFASQLNQSMHDVLRGNNYFVRSQTSKKLLSAWGIQLRWYELKGAKFFGLSQEKADQLALQETRKKISTTPKEGAKISGVSAAAKQANQAIDDCLANTDCNRKFRATGELPPEVTGKIDGIVKTLTGKTAYSGLLSGLNTIYAIGLPVCIVYDGSVQASKAFVNSQNEAAIKTFLAIASADSQQKKGDVTAQAVGAFNRRIGDITDSIPEKIARGQTVDTSFEVSPQAARSGEFSIFDVLFPKGPIGGAANFLADNLCPTITNTGLAAGIIAANLAATIFIGPAEKSVELTAKSFIGRVTAKISEKFTTPTGRAAITNTAKKYASGTGKFAVATEGATYLARMLVLAEMGAFYNGLGNDTLANQADAGGVAYAQEMQRQQLYGRPLTNEEVKITQVADNAFIAQQKNRQSNFEKFFALSNPDSLAAGLILRAPELNVSKVAHFFADIPRVFATIFSPLTHVLQPLAAADTSNDNTNYKIVQWGWSAEEENLIDNDSFGSIENAQILADSGQADAILEEYGKCFSSDIGTLLTDGSVDRDSDGNLQDSGLCSPSNLGPHNPKYGDLVFRWRLDQSYQNTLDELLGIQNLEESSSSSTSITSSSGTTSGTVSGDVQQLAKQLLANPNITYPYDPPQGGGSAKTKDVLEALAIGEKAPVTCANAGITSTDINPNILQFLVELGSQTKIGVNALTDKCHSTGSNHYKGVAVDFNCTTQGVQFNVSQADSIASKYSGGHNDESCKDAIPHWHYDFLVFPSPNSISPSSANCATGSDYVGEQIGYENGTPIKVNLCAINGLSVNDFTPGIEGSESTPGTKYYINGVNNRVLVNATVSKNVVDMVNAAKSDGVALIAFSSFRTNDHQRALCGADSTPCPNGAYAAPGDSRHQRGFAIDFIDSNRNSTTRCKTIPGHKIGDKCVAPGDKIWEWLNKNASRFGYKQLINESWHWSPDGQ